MGAASVRAPTLQGITGMTLHSLESPASESHAEPVDFPPLAVLYKHSPICIVASGAIVEVKAFADENPGVPVYMVDVLGQRSLSQRLARQLGVPHESPQVIVIKDGKASWHQSGTRVRLHSIERAVDAAA